MNYSEFFSLINLDLEGLEKVKIARNENDYNKAALNLKEYYLNRKSPKFFIEDSQKEQIINYVKENCKEDIEEVKKVAEELTQDTFVYRFRWDMERTNVPVTFEKEIDWDHIPFGDPEWCFMLNRHRYWVALGQAYFITGEEKYAKTFCRQLEHWIDNNQNIKEKTKTSWRRIEAGIRCENWIKSYEYFKNSPHFTPELMVKFLSSLYQHCEYLMETFNGFNKISNWGVLEFHGLFEASIFMKEFIKSDIWREESIKRLKVCTRLNVMPDGMQWEQSPMYHNEVYHCLVDNLILAKKNNIDLGQDIEETAKKMAYANLYMAKPNHYEPLHGDSDDNDLRDVITEGALLFNDGVLKFGGYDKVDYENIWNFGIEAVEKYNKLEKLTPPYTSYEFKNNGNYYMRDSFDEDGLYLRLHCGPIGAGHGHMDILHLDVSAYGNDLISDIGRYTYVEGDPWRKYFKVCSAHNVTMVDNKDFTDYVGSWEYHNICAPCDQYWVSEKDFDYAQGSHNGYRKLEDPVYPLRRVLFVKPNYWVVVDSFDCKEKHNFKQLYHFVPGEVNLNPDTKECNTLFEGGNIKIIPISDNKIEAKLEKGYFSPEYNAMVENKVLNYDVEGEGFTTIINVLYPYKNNGEDIPKIEKLQVRDRYDNLIGREVAEAIKLTFKDGEEHIIIVSNRKVSLFCEFYNVDGVMTFGEVVLIKRKNGKEEITVIK